MSNLIQPFDGENTLLEYRDLNYRSPAPLDVIEGTILPIAEVLPGTPGWIPCDGSNLSKSTYPYLFNSIGFEYSQVTEGEFFLVPSIPFSMIKYSPMESPFVLRDVACIKNIIKLMLMSEPGDYPRQEGKGGILYEFIKKPLDDEHKEAIITKINKTMEQYSNLVTHNVFVEADTIGKAWIITLQYSDLLNKTTNSTSVRLEQ